MANITYMITNADHIKKQATNTTCFNNGRLRQLRQLLPKPLQLLRQIRHLCPVFFDQVRRGFVGVAGFFQLGGHFQQFGFGFADFFVETQRNIFNYFMRVRSLKTKFTPKR